MTAFKPILTKHLGQPGSTTLDYYLSIMPGVITSHALERFFNVTPEDRTPRPLTTKLLERPNVCEHIRSLILDLNRAHLITYCVPWRRPGRSRE